MDRITKEQRHKNMQGNKSKGTQIEVLLGKMLWNAGLRYRKNDSSLPGTPDFSLRGTHVAIFCDGVFWHGRNWEERKNDIKSNRDYWYPKIERNIKHDEIITQRLEDMGWKVFRFWEDDIRNYPERCLQEVTDYIHIIKNNISTPDSTYGNACKKISIYGPNSLNRDGSIMSVSDQMAILSHYLHNSDKESVRSFSKEAKGLIQDIMMNSGIAENKRNDFCKVLSSSTFKASIPHSSAPLFTFADLFSGIGGMRLGLESCGGRCIFASEWDLNANHIYFNNYGEVPFGDITKEETKQYLPENIDIVCASLPLQRFALIRRRNIWDKIKGTLFYDTAEIIRRRKPSCVLLEFPACQKDYARGTYCKILYSMLENELGYFVKEPAIINTASFGSAQEKEILYIIAFSDKANADEFKIPEYAGDLKVFDDIMEKDIVSAKYYLRERTLNKGKTLIKAYKSNERIKVTRNTFILDSRTTDILPSTKKLDKINKKGIRRITIKEHMRLQGFPDTFSIGNIGEREMHKLLLAASPVNVIRELGREIVRCGIHSHKIRKRD